jgi:hypothetical protein
VLIQSSLDDFGYEAAILIVDGLLIPQQELNLNELGLLARKLAIASNKKEGFLIRDLD